MAVEIPKNLSDHPQLVGIVRFPNCIVTTTEVVVPTVTKNNDTKRYQSIRQAVEMATTINSRIVESAVINVDKSNVTDFYPYTYYVLTDAETEPLIMYPQYLPNSFTIKGNFALSHSPIERYYPSLYKGDSTGNIYNITNTSQMMLPTSSNEGVAYMTANSNSMLSERQNRKIQNVISAVGVVSSASKGNFNAFLGSGASLVSGFLGLKQADARTKDLQMTPNSISSYGTPSTRRSFGTDVVRVLKYTVMDNVKNKIIAFSDRYGNKFNNYDTINLKTYKGYVKFISPDIDTNIDIIYVNKLIQVLERGVFCE